MKFLEKIIDELLSKNADLSAFTFILPGKRPIVFIKKILEEKNYSGFLPTFLSIEDLIKDIAEQQELKPISLWLFGFQVYNELNLSPKDDFSGFLKWFPTVLKDWDDMMKFSENDQEVLEYMFHEERIKNWAENLGDSEDVPRRRFLNFWKNMNVFLPILKEKLQEKNWATAGMIHEIATHKIDDFVQKTQDYFVFCGFNALTTVEEKLVRTLLQWDKADCFFNADTYYIKDEKQEAGAFLRNYQTWKEFNNSRPFSWVEHDFEQPKNIQVFEVSGNVSQSKILPKILKDLPNSESKQSTDTAVILLDENLLPACLDSLYAIDNLNITMGFPLKNLGFSNAVKQLFYLQKQLEKSDATYYFHDVISIIEEFPRLDSDQKIIENFKNYIEERNIVYISKKLMRELLGNLSYFALLLKPTSVESFLEQVINYCYQLKFNDLDDTLYENISYFESAFKLLKNQITDFPFALKMENLEVLVQQLVHAESIDFQGEPLTGLQIMGLLETRLLNFKNIILLSVNEGKLPLGNTQNTYLPFDVRSHFNMHTFLVNDSIYAYHFYRLLQGAENVFLLYNEQSSGANTGEKSRFITQLEMESKHEIQHFVIENSTEPTSAKLMEIPKSETAMQQLQKWRNRIAPTHLTSYLYDPISFYMNKVLGTRDAIEIEEELSSKNYGNLVHYSLQVLYEKVKNINLKISDLKDLLKEIDEALGLAIKKLNHQPEYYERGINFIHKSMAKKVIESIIQYDLELVKNGNSLKILALEKNFENVDFYLNDEQTESVAFYGYIDRIDVLNDTIRIIDYKTGKSKKLEISIKDENRDHFLMNKELVQALQLCIYQFVIEQDSEFRNKEIMSGIWSFAEVNRGVIPLVFKSGDLQDALVSIRSLIVEILDPEIPFIESKKVNFQI